MAKGPQCAGTTASGAQCTRSATTGKFCKTHARANGVDPKPAKPARDTPLILEYASIAGRCIREMEATVTEGVRIQWMRLIFDCCKSLKEEMRLSEGAGAGFAYTFHMHPPAPSPVTEDEPERAVDADAADRTIN